MKILSREMIQVKYNLKPEDKLETEYFYNLQFSEERELESLNIKNYVIN